MAKNMTCTIHDCDQTHYAKGLCRSHYMKDRYRAKKGLKSCVLCPAPAEKGRDLCAACYDLSYSTYIKELCAYTKHTGELPDFEHEHNHEQWLENYIREISVTS